MHAGASHIWLTSNERAEERVSFGMSPGSFRRASSHASISGRSNERKSMGQRSISLRLPRHHSIALSANAAQHHASSARRHAARHVRYAPVVRAWPIVAPEPHSAPGLAILTPCSRGCNGCHQSSFVVQVVLGVGLSRRHSVVARSAQWRRGIAAIMSGLLRVLAQPGGMRFDGVEFLRADTHRGWGIASMARGAARWARFS